MASCFLSSIGTPLGTEERSHTGQHQPISLRSRTPGSPLGTFTYLGGHRAVATLALAKSKSGILNLVCQGAEGWWTGLGWATVVGGQARVITTIDLAQLN